MSWRGLPRTYYAFALVTVAGFPVAMLANGALLLACAFMSIALLLSPPMCDYVRLRPI
jgi:hypothetical protein